MPRHLLIAGKKVEGQGRPLTAVNPVDGSVVDTVGTPSPEQIDDAVRRASAAASDSKWRNLLPHARADYLHKAAARLAERAEELARLQMAENGKTLAECREQAISTVGIIRYFASLCETLESEVTPPRGSYVSMTVYEPLGVVLAVTPYNSPLTLGAQKVAAALAAGNAVILKPSHITSITSLELGQVFVDAGLPPGLISVLPGGTEVGMALVEHPDVNMISFTGGTKTGQAIAQAVARRLIPVVLELGGKSPNIVFDDADMELTIPAIPYSAFSSMGQSCTTGTRLFVQRTIYDKFVKSVVDLTKRIRIGHPEDPRAMLGPLSSFDDLKRVEGWVARAAQEGGRILVGGERPTSGDLSRGAYYMPTIIDGLDNTASLCQEEVFGPVLCVLPFEGEDDLIRQANGTVYGLAAGIWTRDFAKAWRVARALDAGSVWINTYRNSSISTPFGGFKHSGLGREKGPHGIRIYQEAKSMYFGLAPMPWHTDLTESI